MNSQELQNTIDSHLKITGDDGKFRIKVAKDGTIWRSNERENKEENVIS